MAIRAINYNDTIPWSLMIARGQCSLNWYKFLISALSSLINGMGMVHYQYFVTALKIIYDNIVCFCVHTSEMYQILNII